MAIYRRIKSSITFSNGNVNMVAWKPEVHFRKISENSCAWF